MAFKIYLAGKMSGIDIEESDTWRRLSTILIRDRAYTQGVKVNVVNPNNFYNPNTKGHKTEKEAMQFDLNHVSTSDLIMVNLKEVNTSVGTAMELLTAAQLNIPVIAFGTGEEYSETHPWIKECISRVESNMVDAIEYIRDYYFVQN